MRRSGQQHGAHPAVAPAGAGPGAIPAVGVCGRPARQRARRGQRSSRAGAPATHLGSPPPFSGPLQPRNAAPNHGGIATRRRLRQPADGAGRRTCALWRAHSCRQAQGLWQPLPASPPLARLALPPRRAQTTCRPYGLLRVVVSCARLQPAHATPPSPTTMPRHAAAGTGCALSRCQHSAQGFNAPGARGARLHAVAMDPLRAVGLLAAPTAACRAPQRSPPRRCPRVLRASATGC
jgi:hypothetical protein